MESLSPRWSLLDTATNQRGVTHFTLSCRGVSTADGDYEELMGVLECEFSAVEKGELLGPYSVHKYLKVRGLRIGLILDSPVWLDLYARDERDKAAMESFITKLLHALNGQENASATR